jgi:type I restriction enzyme R subunit
MNEAETRAEHIDPALAAAGWGVVEGSRFRREYPITLGRIEGHGRRGKPLIADYVLIHRNHPLAVVEAKAWDEEVTEGVAQAKNYAGKLAVRCTYSTNGQGIYGIDMQTGKEGAVPRFPTPDELWNLTFAEANAWRDRFAAVPFEDRGGFFQGRYYQDIAIDRVLEAIAAGKSRILLTLATGTGKTFIAFQIAWKLFHSRWNLSGEPSRRPRILFLADRNILADQAYNAFSAFPEDALVRIEPDEIRRRGRVPKNGSLFFTIFQTFMSGPPNDLGRSDPGIPAKAGTQRLTARRLPPVHARGRLWTPTSAGAMAPYPEDGSGSKDSQPSPYFGDYPPDFFDFIVIDECHRGGANDESNWRGILDYFAPAVQLGLTASRNATKTSTPTLILVIRFTSTHSRTASTTVS